MAVFDALPTDGSSSNATLLADKLGVEKELLGESFIPSSKVWYTKALDQVRFMRILTAVVPFAEVGEEEYTHTPYSMVYLVPELRGIFKLMSETPFVITH